MNDYLRKIVFHLPGAAVVVLGVMLVWQVMGLGTTAWQTFLVNRRVRKWELASQKEDAKPKPEPGKNKAEPGPGAPNRGPQRPEESPTAAKADPGGPKPNPTGDAGPKGKKNDKPGGKQGKGKAKGEESKYDKMMKDGPFAKIKPKPQPAVLTGILGEYAIINGQTVKVGEQAGPWKVIEICQDKVVVEKEGEKRELKLFPELTAK